MTVHVDTIDQGARWLLADAVRIGRQCGLRFAVIGGWSPVLLNNGPIVHPGTRDVDMLFEKGTEPGALKAMLKRFAMNITTSQRSTIFSFCG